MLISGRSNINTGRVDAAVPEHVCKLYGVPLVFIENPGKQMSEIMREYFFRLDLCRYAKSLHHSPYARTVEWFAASATDKNRPGIDFHSAGVVRQ